MNQKTVSIDTELLSHLSPQELQIYLQLKSKANTELFISTADALAIDPSESTVRINDLLDQLVKKVVITPDSDGYWFNEDGTPNYCQCWRDGGLSFAAIGLWAVMKDHEKFPNVTYTDIRQEFEEWSTNDPELNNAWIELDDLIDLSEFTQINSNGISDAMTALYPEKSDHQ